MKDEIFGIIKRTGTNLLITTILLLATTATGLKLKQVTNSTIGELTEVYDALKGRFIVRKNA